ncbi:hypothetical protein ACFP3U_03185 [Kitasatospora misakiensis]|uniref:Luciferase-like domain-containing protein n=1 Tax=Kitasatospora misakiensis TaxID=67330 RepID=A0ABW0X0H3_9ACTN
MSIENTAVVFGIGAPGDLAGTARLLDVVQQADRDGLDHFSLSDHPYLGGRVDAHAALGFLPGRITDRPLAATRDAEGRWLGGSVGQWVEELTGAVLEHGASGFTLFATDHGSPDPVTLGRWAREVAPAVREAVAKG